MPRAKRRGNGEGSITFRHNDNRYQASYYPTPGKRRYVYGKTRKEAWEKMMRAMSEGRGAFHRDAGRITVGEYLDRWLADSVRHRVKTSTYERYEQIVRLHVKPDLGSVKLKDLGPLHVQALYSGKLDAGVSAAMGLKIHNVLHGALGQAVTLRLVAANACDGARPPRPKKKEIVPLTAEQAKAFLDAVRGDRLEAFYVLAISTGARKGELLALRWDDLDPKRGLMRISRGLTREGGRHEPGETKNKEGREVALPALAQAALLSHRKRQLEERLELGDLWHDENLVFTTSLGTLINPSNVRKRSYIPLLEKAGLPTTTRFHDLRHTCATLLFKERAHPKEVQALLGHKNVSITLDTYSHFIPSMGKETAAAMERALS